MRTLRPKTPVIYAADEEFPIGGSKVVRSSTQDQVTVVASGITVHNAIQAAGHAAGGGHFRPPDRRLLHQAH
jgi:transketolase